VATTTERPEISTYDLIKRVLVGRRVATSHLEHTLLPKVLALPVFSSDALSSVAYATEEILKVLLMASAAAAALVLPISFAIAALMVIVVVSYRQTVRAYPSGGGAYIVSKDNLGVFPGLLAAAALLTDYVLTVSVSVVAGVFAITSAIQSLHDYRLVMSLGFVGLITLANLRGVRESGTVFAIPTYGFILSIVALLITGLVKCSISACPAAVVPAEHISLGTAAGASLFVVLHSFSSGSTALTGVEAISNGVPAFRKPQAKNAATTLGIMGAISVTMFLGISFLARMGHAIPSDTKSVVAEIAEGVFGHGGMFFVVQVFTAAILVLAANTSYQDFPRLASILARDHYVPRQFENRGDRLVFSNGVILLGIMASLLIWVFDARLDNLIQLYVVGVFTSFTLSQTGMVRHWLKIRREGGEDAAGWLRSLVINSIGALATFVVLLVVIETKFLAGAWIVIAAMPIIIGGFYAIHSHYVAVQQLVRRGLVPLSEAPVNHVVLYVEDINPAMVEAVGYIRGFSARTGFRAVHVGRGSAAAELAARWRTFSRTDVELEILHGDNPSQAVIQYVRGIPREPSDFVTVVIPESFRRPSLLAAVRRRTTFLLKVRLLAEPQVVVTDVPVVTTERGVKTAPVIPVRTVALVFVGGVNDATHRAVNYARSLQASETRAVYFALDPAEIEQVQREWEARHIQMELDIVEAPFRDLGPPMVAEVRQVTSQPDSVAAVVIPEIVPKKWWHAVLHRQRPLFIKRLLLFEPRVILSSVPYHLK
jgi:amino acid transporter